MFRTRPGLLAAAIAMASMSHYQLGAEVVPRSPGDYPPDPPKPKRQAQPFDGPQWARKRREKAEKAERRRVRKAGVSGAGLWRKCAAGGRVRGW
jgi:hypothetical protein